MTSRGAYTHYMQSPCETVHRHNEVRTWNQHPIRTLFNTPHRKTYVVENRTAEPKKISVGLKPYEHEEAKEDFLIIPPFCEKTLLVNTAKQSHHFLKVHHPSESKVLSAKFLNPVYSLATILGHHDCGVCIQLQITPSW